MKLIFKQKFAFLAKYEIYDEADQVIYYVESDFAFSQRLHVYDAHHNYLGTVKQKVWTWMPRYEIYIGEYYAGTVSKKFSWFGAKLGVDYRGWQVEGDFWEWDYSICDSTGRKVATISKEPFKFMDTYVIDVDEADNALHALMLVIAIDAEKAARSSN